MTEITNKLDDSTPTEEELEALYNQPENAHQDPTIVAAAENLNTKMGNNTDADRAEHKKKYEESVKTGGQAEAPLPPPTPIANGKKVTEAKKALAAARKAAAAAKKALSEATGAENPPLKTPIGVQQRDIAMRLINYFKSSSDAEKPAALKFKVGAVADTRGELRPFQIVGSMCVDISMSAVTEMTLDYVHRAAEEPYNAWTHRTAEGCAKLWLSLWRGEAKAVIEPFCFNEQSKDNTLCYHRLPFKIEKGDMPDWLEFLSRIEIEKDREALCAWIWSLFEMYADRQQYIWLVGKGRDSKGALLRILDWVFGCSANSLQVGPDPKGNKHWAADYVNRRLIMFPDFDDFPSLNRGAFKSVTGGDAVSVRELFRPAYSAKLFCKCIFTSNGMPGIDDAESNLRRIIYIPIDQASKTHDQGYEERLMAQTGAFLDHCRDIYKRLYPDHGPIAGSAKSKEAIEDFAASSDAEFDLFFEENIELMGPEKYVHQHDLQSRLKDRGVNNTTEQKRFKRWLDRKHDRKMSRQTIGGKQKRVYLGIALKPIPILRNTSPVSHETGPKADHETYCKKF